MIKTEQITLEKISMIYEIKSKKHAKQKTNCIEPFYTTRASHFATQKQKNPFVKDVLAKSGFISNLSLYSISDFPQSLVNTTLLSSRTSLPKQKSPNPAISVAKLGL